MSIRLQAMMPMMVNHPITPGKPLIKLTAVYLRLETGYFSKQEITGTTSLLRGAAANIATQ
jgi:hypothetical protein